MIEELMSAIQLGDEKQFQMLIDLALMKHVDLDACAKNEMTLLNYAISRMQNRCVKILLESGVNPMKPNASDSDFPLLVAVRTGNVAAIDLLHQYHADFNQESQHTSETSLMAAVSANNIDIVAKLITLGAQIDYIANTGLVLEKFSDSLRNMPVWLSKAIEIKCMAASGIINAGAFAKIHSTAWGVAILCANEAVISLFLSHCSDLEFSKEVLFVTACFGHEKTMSVALDAVKKHNLSDSEVVNLAYKGSSLLALAAGHNGLDVVRLLVKRGAEIDGQEGQVAPIHVAAINGAEQIVRFLLNHKAKVSASVGMYIKRALARGYFAIAQMLVVAQDSSPDQVREYLSYLESSSVANKSLGILALLHPRRDLNTVLSMQLNHVVHILYLKGVNIQTLEKLLSDARMSYGTVLPPMLVHGLTKLLGDSESLFGVSLSTSQKSALDLLIMLFRNTLSFSGKIPLNSKITASALNEVLDNKIEAYHSVMLQGHFTLSSDNDINYQSLFSLLTIAISSMYALSIKKLLSCLDRIEDSYLFVSEFQIHISRLIDVANYFKVLISSVHPDVYYKTPFILDLQRKFNADMQNVIESLTMKAKTFAATNSAKQKPVKIKQQKSKQIVLDQAPDRSLFEKILASQSKIGYAIVNRDSAMLRYCIERGEDTSIRVLSMPLLAWAVDMDNTTDCLQAMLEHECFYDDIPEAFAYAINAKHEKAIRLFVNKLYHFNSDFIARLFNRPNKRSCPMYFAVFCNNHDLIEELLSLGISASSSYFNISCLAVAAYLGDLRSVNLLLQNNADLNDVDTKFTPLLAAMLGDQTEMVKVLLSLGADPLLMFNDLRLLQYAIALANIEIVVSCLESIAAKVEPKILEEILFFAVQSNRYDVVKAVLNSDTFVVDPLIKIEMLVAACQKNHVAIAGLFANDMKYLLEQNPSYSILIREIASRYDVQLCRYAVLGDQSVFTSVIAPEFTAKKHDIFDPEFGLNDVLKDTPFFNYRTRSLPNSSSVSSSDLLLLDLLSLIDGLTKDEIQSAVRLLSDGLVKKQKDNVVSDHVLNFAVKLNLKYRDNICPSVNEFSLKLVDALNELAVFCRNIDSKSLRSNAHIMLGSLMQYVKNADLLLSSIDFKNIKNVVKKSFDWHHSLSHFGFIYYNQLLIAVNALTELLTVVSSQIYKKLASNSEMVSIYESLTVLRNFAYGASLLSDVYLMIFINDEMASSSFKSLLQKLDKIKTDCVLLELELEDVVSKKSPISSDEQRKSASAAKPKKQQSKAGAEQALKEKAEQARIEKEKREQEAERERRRAERKEEKEAERRAKKNAKKKEKKLIKQTANKYLVKDEADHAVTLALTPKICDAFQLLESIDPSCRLVGGAVVRLYKRIENDLKTSDYDFVGRGLIDQLQSKGFTKVPFDLVGCSHADLYQYKNEKEQTMFDFVSCKQDADFWELDANSRDFTICALYANKHGEIFDPTGLGFEHLNHNVLSMIGDPAVRIKEDPRRVLRAIKYILLGFIPDAKLDAALRSFNPDDVDNKLGYYKTLEKFTTDPEYKKIFITKAVEYGVIKRPDVPSVSHYNGGFFGSRNHSYYAQESASSIRYYQPK